MSRSGVEGGEGEAVLGEHDPQHLEERRPAQRHGGGPERDERQHAPLGVPGLETDRRDEPAQCEREARRRSRRARAERCRRASAAARVCARRRRARARRARPRARRVRPRRRRRSRPRMCRRAGEDQRLDRDQRDGDRASANDDHRDTETDEQPDESAAHARLLTRTNQLTIPRSAAAAPTASSRGASRMRIFALSVSSTASAAQSTTSTTGSSASCPQTLSCGAGRSGRRARARPSAGRRRPLQERQVASGVLEQRPFVDHRQLEMGVGVVDWLATGLGDDHESERHRGETERGVRPDGRARCARDHRGQVRRAGNERGDRRREHERHLGEDRDHQVAARAHQRKAVRDVPRCCCDGEPSQREQTARAREHRVPPRATAPRRHRDEQNGQRETCRSDRRGEPVDDARALDLDRALAPEPAQFAVGLKRRRPAPSLQPGLPVLDEPRQERRKEDPAGELDGRSRARSSDQARFGGRQQHQDERDQVRDVGAEASSLQPPRVGGGSECDPHRRREDTLVEELRDATAVGDLLDPFRPTCAR